MTGCFVSRLCAGAAAVAALLVAPEASAVRWTLGVATELTPIVIDPGRTGGDGPPTRIGLRPVIDLEVNHWFSIGAYAPFVVLRLGEASGAASTGAEAVFGLQLAGRYPILRATAPEEILTYVVARGGFGTANGRAGPFLGGAVGAMVSWLSTGRGLFAELSTGYVAIDRVPDGVITRDLERVSFGITVGLIFHLGGERWRLERRPLPAAPDPT